MEKNDVAYPHVAPYLNDVTQEYITDGNAIYRRSFAMIRAESDLRDFSEDQARVAVRMIHAAGDTALAKDIAMSDDVVEHTYAALAQGAPILCDVTMVATGITRMRLPAHNDIRCLLHDPAVPELAHTLGTTRSAAAVELWKPDLANAVVAIGNAPTALFHLLNELAASPKLPRPAAIVGIPVGFVGAAESKLALARMAEQLGTHYITVHGRRGGSAITCAALNALAHPEEIMS
ncbi:precorrin-8X methylmutase [Corynebacterium sp. sy017]|uniref:precorrin-8X methylmutase n=1 Tax=unclassified Corynebacterium TaxID=2624378 RepID=UPI0011867E0D|nr:MULTISPECIES: precorrin-8X methylmutase [unclassified Corynebacterium]MBP3087595.1 precorrin-8X methylmutase [Corynebacterium sp. sy017]TSD92714.1 precorrin-8X methylmutase [Corynebacterium sp. SY003]